MKPFLTLLDAYLWTDRLKYPVSDFCFLCNAGNADKEPIGVWFDRQEHLYKPLWTR